MNPTEEMVRVAAIAVRQARNGCITPPENGTEYDEQLARAALSAALAAMWRAGDVRAHVSSACLSYRHDFGLLPPEEQEMIRFQAKEWLHAWRKELEPAPTLLSTRMGSEKTAESGHSDSTRERE